jgi:hypothetical protein
MYSGDKSSEPLCEDDDARKIVSWLLNTSVPLWGLEVYRHAEADSVRAVDFLDSHRVIREDKVNHPKHYTAYKGIEVIQLTEQMNFNRGNAVKYISRAGLKNPDTEIEDLEKARWYIQREIDRIKNV